MKEKQVKRHQRHKRIRAKIHGTAQCPRLSVFRSNQHLCLQLVDDNQGKTLVSSSDSEVKKKNKKASKFDRMLDNLKQKGYITIAQADELSDQISRSFHARVGSNLPEDRYNVYKYMWRLL